MKKLIILIMIFSFMYCGKKSEVNTFPIKKISDDPFFEVTRFIMAKEEIEIYKHLPDEEAREAFRKEFWDKRDPNPYDEENENKAEYEERIAYANKWFREGSKRRGWDTTRGRILLQLGIPDERQFGQVPFIDRLGATTTKHNSMEIWVYFRHKLVLRFADRQGLGVLKLETYSAQILTALDLVKFEVDLRGQKSRRALKFEAKFKENNINIELPVKRINFDEEENKAIAEFNIMVYVYLDYKKIDEITVTKIIEKEKAEFLRMNKIQFEIPYSPKEKGKYFFDVIIEDKKAATRYRNFCKYKH